MTATQTNPARSHFWKTVLLFGAIHFLVMCLGMPRRPSHMSPADTQGGARAKKVIREKTSWAGEPRHGQRRMRPPEASRPSSPR